MTETREPKLSVGDFLIDPDDERVSGPDGPVSMGRKAYEVFYALARRRGRLLTKDVLFESVWDGMAVSESALTTTIRELRRAIGDPTREPRYIESVYGRGYRMVAPVMEIDEDGEVGAPPVAVTQSPPLSPRDNGQGSMPRIVVGAFADEAIAEANPHFGPAIREEVLLGLSRFHEIQVVDGGSSDSDSQARDYRLDARFLPDGERTKAGVRLKRMEDGRIVWGETIAFEDDGMGVGIERIVRQIVGAALPALDQDVSLGIGEAPGTLFDRYILAKRRSLDAQDFGEARSAARELEAIIAEKPGFALAYPPLVRLYNIDFGYTALGSTGPEERARALALAKKGLAADRSHVHAYTVIGFCHLYEGDHDQAHSCFEHALRRNPFNPDRLNEVATGMTYLGDFDRAQALFEQSAGIQPFADDNSQEDLGRLAMLRGDMEAASDHFSRVTVASLWAELCRAVTLRETDRKKGNAAVSRWTERVYRNWHGDERPGDQRILDWFVYHHPFRDDAGAPLVDRVEAGLFDR